MGISKIWKPGPLNKSRLHDQKGNLIDLGGLVYLPKAVVSFTMLKLLGRRPATPWLGFRAIKELDRLIKPDWTLLEFGSGMSSLWLARRCKKLVSIESHAGWHGTVQKMFADAGVTNIEYLQRSGPAYHDLSAYPDQSFDFVLVDGDLRGDCAIAALPKLKPGGYMYLDNSDFGASPADTGQAEVRVAEKAIRDAVAAKGGEIKCFTDFPPTMLNVTQGLLARIG